jgi:2-polyprenyl-3-methyl-5-hydroxy-6-metoxy-1,4-benzoquinol methylase
VKKIRRHLLTRRKLHAILTALAKPGPVLDVGCGWGHTLEQNLPDGFEPWGIEISEALAADARRRFEPRGGQVWQGDAVTCLRGHDAGFFHAVTMIAILEHVVDPVPLLVEVRRVLATDGIVVIKVPNFGSVNRVIRGRRWCGLRFPDHVNYFTPGSLRECASRAGLGIVRFGWLDRQPTSDNMWCVLGQGP